MTFQVILAAVPTDNIIKPNKSSSTKELDVIREKKKEERNISDIESNNESSDDGDVDNSSIDSDREESDDDDIENVDGVNKENVQ